MRIGIDLGTSTSLVTAFRNGAVEIIPNRFGNKYTPSVVHLTPDGEWFVGEPAKERLITHPDRTVASFKRLMGRQTQIHLGDQTFSPEEISSVLLRELISNAEDYLEQKIDEVVISVPAYFQDKQRVATKKAGALAGVKVARLINEPSAAALNAYVHQNQEQKYIVCDFGGGTLDISLVDCFDNMIEILAISGDNRLGGDDFDQVITKVILADNGIEASQLSEESYAILKSHAEKLKRRLSTESEVTFEWDWEGKLLTSHFDNQRLISAGAEIFARMKATIAGALRDANMRASQVDAIVFVGGSSRMPIVKSYLGQLFAGLPQVDGDEQERVVRGLGLILGIMDRDDKVKDYIMTDISPFSLGIETLNEQDPNLPYMTPILERNTALPSSRVESFYTTYDGQTNIVVSILQGEQVYAKDNLKLGELKVTVPPQGRGEERIDVRFTYDLNGILDVDVHIPSTGKRMSQTIANELTEADIQVAQERLKHLKHHPKEEAANQLLKDRLLTAYASANITSKNHLKFWIDRFDRILASQDRRKIRQFAEEMNRALNVYEEFDPFYRGDVFLRDEEDWEDEWEGDDSMTKVDEEEVLSQAQEEENHADDRL
ncbi:Hsp70 family protein [Streptococcus suis]|nr:Hsp70 family protein [Streptococcus suis]